VSFIIADYLLFGIASTTDRARYFSFFCWALWHIAKEQPPERYADFVRQLRRREAVVALATLANDPKASPVGVTATKIEWKKGLQGRQFNTDFRVLPSSTLGAYGQYYAGSLANLGLTETGKDGFDRVGSGLANTLATAFHAAVAKTAYIKKRLFASEWIRLEDLRATGKYLTIDALSAGVAEGERKGLIDTFFGLSERFATDRHLVRRHTLLHILHVIEAEGVLGPCPFGDGDIGGDADFGEVAGAQRGDVGAVQFNVNRGCGFER
jgi:hypothetical protein